MENSIGGHVGRRAGYRLILVAVLFSAALAAGCAEYRADGYSTGEAVLDADSASVGPHWAAEETSAGRNPYDSLVAPGLPPFGPIGNSANDGSKGPAGPPPRQKGVPPLRY